MEAVILLGALIAAYVILLRRGERRRWVVFHESSAHRPDETTKLHMRLRHRGVRCRLKVVGTGLGSQNTTFLGDRSLGQSFQLLVHEDDADDARRLMETHEASESSP